jgi:AcrR family transcriptional regulator
MLHPLKYLVVNATHKGGRMNYAEEVKQTLINNTVKLISEGGFERATTRAIAFGNTSEHGVKLNEAYIYRLFGGKEDLYKEVFLLIDQAMSNELAKYIDGNAALIFDTKNELRRIFDKAWHLLLQHEMTIRCYVRYYHSAYFKGELLSTHRQIFKRVIDKFSPLFREEADVFEIMHSVFMSLLNFAERVYNGVLENRPDNVEHVFNVLYCIVSFYLKDNAVSQKKELAYI